MSPSATDDIPTALCPIYSKQKDRQLHLRKMTSINAVLQGNSQKLTLQLTDLQFTFAGRQHSLREAGLCEGELKSFRCDNRSRTSYIWIGCSPCQPQQPELILTQQSTDETNCPLMMFHNRYDETVLLYKYIYINVHYCSATTTRRPF